MLVITRAIIEKKIRLRSSSRCSINVIAEESFGSSSSSVEKIVSKRSCCANFFVAMFVLQARHQRQYLVMSHICGVNCLALSNSIGGFEATLLADVFALDGLEGGNFAHLCFFYFFWFYFFRMTDLVHAFAELFDAA